MHGDGVCAPVQWVVDVDGFVCAVVGVSRWWLVVGRWPLLSARCVGLANDLLPATNGDQFATRAPLAVGSDKYQVKPFTGVQLFHHFTTQNAFFHH